MSETKYTFNANSFINQKVDSTALTYEIRESTITIALDHIDVTVIAGDGFNCDIWFKDELPETQYTTLSGLVYNHSGVSVEEVKPLTMDDGRLVVRPESRPMNNRTYFTSTGDHPTTHKLGEGKSIKWDFSNDDDLYNPIEVLNGPTIDSGYKAKIINVCFNDPVYIKDGTMYFYDAPWGCYVSMYVTVPSGSYYPNPYGSIPATALGLTGTGKYAHASKNVFYACYVQKQYMYTNCPMGDELNAEGCQVNALPTGWYVSALVVTPDSDTVSKGYGSLEMFRTADLTLEDAV
jgi:hypothetical protein